VKFALLYHPQQPLPNQRLQQWMDWPLRLDYLLTALFLMKTILVLYYGDDGN
jgi:hypothetical protein